MRTISPTDKEDLADLLTTRNYNLMASLATNEIDRLNARAMVELREGAYASASKYQAQADGIRNFFTDLTKEVSR